MSHTDLCAGCLFLRGVLRRTLVLFLRMGCACMIYELIFLFFSFFLLPPCGKGVLGSSGVGCFALSLLRLID